MLGDAKGIKGVPRVCWVLDGGLRCASVRERARACACACNVRVRLRVCSFVGLCPFARARRVRACMRASVSACACSCDSIGLQFRVCVRRSAVRALPSHGGGLRYV